MAKAKNLLNDREEKRRLIAMFLYVNSGWRSTAELASLMKREPAGLGSALFRMYKTGMIDQKWVMVGRPGSSRRIRYWKLKRTERAKITRRLRIKAENPWRISDGR